MTNKGLNSGSSSCVRYVSAQVKRACWAAVGRSFGPLRIVKGVPPQNDCRRAGRGKSHTMGTTFSQFWAPIFRGFRSEIDANS